MYQKLIKIYHIGQILFSVLVIFFGFVYSLRCLLCSQFFAAVCFAVIGYVCGYCLFLRASLSGFKQFKNKGLACKF